MTKQTELLMKFSSDILKIIDDDLENELSRGDLQGVVEAVIYKTLDAGYDEGYIQGTSETNK